MLFNSRTWFNPAQRHTPFLFDVLRRCSTGKSYNVCRQQHNDQNIIYTNYTEFSMCSCANINQFLLRKTVAFFTKPNSVALWPFDLLPYQQKNHNTIITFFGIYMWFICSTSGWWTYNKRFESRFFVWLIVFFLLKLNVDSTQKSNIFYIIKWTIIYILILTIAFTPVLPYQSAEWFVHGSVFHHCPSENFS